MQKPVLIEVDFGFAIAGIVASRLPRDNERDLFQLAEDCGEFYDAEQMGL